MDKGGGCLFCAVMIVGWVIVCQMMGGWMEVWIEGEICAVFFCAHCLMSYTAYYNICRTFEDLFLCKQMSALNSFLVDPKLIQEKERLRVKEKLLISFLENNRE